MINRSDDVEEHESGTRYGGKILSMTPAPEGWFVGTQEERIHRKSRQVEREEAKVFPLIAWVLVDAMFRGGDRKTQVEPLFLSDTGITHETHFRWSLGAGEVDGDWRTLVAVEVIPASSATVNVPAYGRPAFENTTDIKETS
ncbi:hypothetical protein [Streptomyces cyaneofuscatus]|uniref:hypothetical protein n=1 Tax=Streptomyces cyaneofuscatus TaxID=66883 RepID=UPI003665A02C